MTIQVCSWRRLETLKVFRWYYARVKSMIREGKLFNDIVRIIVKYELHYYFEKVLCWCQVNSFEKPSQSFQATLSSHHKSSCSIPIIMNLNLGIRRGKKIRARPCLSYMCVLLTSCLPLSFFMGFQLYVLYSAYTLFILVP